MKRGARNRASATDLQIIVGLLTWHPPAFAPAPRSPAGRPGRGRAAVLPMLAGLRLPPPAPFASAGGRAGCLPPLEGRLPADRTRGGYQNRSWQRSSLGRA